MKTFVLATALLGAVNALTVMPPMSKTAEHIPLAKKAMEYFDNSPDPFHAVQTAIDMLEDAGFEEVQDIEPNSDKIQPGR
jgi:aspartyl aminopeptidase